MAISHFGVNAQKFARPTFASITVSLKAIDDRNLYHPKRNFNCTILSPLSPHAQTSVGVQA